MLLIPIWVTKKKRKSIGHQREAEKAIHQKTDESKNSLNCKNIMLVLSFHSERHWAGHVAPLTEQFTLPRSVFQEGREKNRIYQRLSLIRKPRTNESMSKFSVNALQLTFCLVVRSEFGVPEARINLAISLCLTGGQCWPTTCHGSRECVNRIWCGVEICRWYTY